MNTQSGQFADRGFTLLELMVTLLVIGLITAVTPPLFSNVVPGVRFEQTVIDLQSTLRKARSQAITGSDEVVISFDPDARSYSMDDEQRVDLPGDITLSVSRSGRDLVETASEQRIRFFPDGSSTGSVIKLSSDDRMAEIEVAWLTGKVDLRLGSRHEN
jgi:general secretion pathway protein H